MTVAFLLTALIVCISPGIGVVYTLSMSLRGGIRAGLWASIGCTLCTVLHLGFALAGLAAILHTTAVLFQAIKFAGVAYLLWMAWATLRRGGSLDLRSRAETGSSARIVWRGVLLNLLNPKLPLFFVAFLPQFVPRGDSHATLLLAELGVVFVAMTFAVFATYAVFAGAARRAIVESPRALRVMRRLFAASFAALGLRLAFERA
ncbi:MAG TPA: LysE family translocator [Gaiellaceae bacterium]|nr:LysE family translocator [Gaiellaceae bacterium]